MDTMSHHRATYHEILRRNIGGALGRAEWTRSRAASELNLKPNSFSAKMHGRNEFRVQDLIRLAKALNITFSELVAGMDEAAQLHENGDREEVAS